MTTAATTSSSSTTDTTTTTTAAAAFVKPRLPALNISFQERKRRFYSDVERALYTAVDTDESSAMHVHKSARVADSMPATPRIIYVTREDGASRNANHDDASTTTSTTSGGGTHSAPALPYQGVVNIQKHKCICCWMTYDQRLTMTQHNYGLLHTLYAYRKFFVELFALYERRVIGGKRSKEITDQLASLMLAYGMSHRSRPVALRVPFEEGLKGLSYIHFNGWVCPSVSRAVSLATLMITSERNQRNIKINLDYNANVVLPTLIYLHEALARRVKLGKKQYNSPVRLAPIQDAVSEHDDTFLKFLISSSVKSATEQCEEFARSQAKHWPTCERNKSDTSHPLEHMYLFDDMPNTTMSLLQSVVRAYNDGDMTLDESESALCCALIEGGRSGVDYLFPGQTPVAINPTHSLKYDAATRSMRFDAGVPASSMQSPPSSMPEQFASTASAADAAFHAYLDKAIVDVELRQKRMVVFDNIIASSS